jgi:hypothetical protein
VICSFRLVAGGLARMGQQPRVGGILQENPFFVDSRRVFGAAERKAAISIDESGVRLRSRGPNTNKSAAEVRNLKACVNDLVGVLTLPAMWSGSEPDQTVVMLLDVVLRTLRLESTCPSVRAMRFACTP